MKSTHKLREMKDGACETEGRRGLEIAEDSLNIILKDCSAEGESRKTERDTSSMFMEPQDLLEYIYLWPCFLAM